MLFTESSYSNRQPVGADVKFSREKDRALKWQFVELLFQWHLVARVPTRLDPSKKKENGGLTLFGRAPNGAGATVLVS
jgi:hypothetical protein